MRFVVLVRLILDIGDKRQALRPMPLPARPKEETKTAKDSLSRKPFPFPFARGNIIQTKPNRLPKPVEGKRHHEQEQDQL